MSEIIGSIFILLFIVGLLTTLVAILRSSTKKPTRRPITEPTEPFIPKKWKGNRGNWKKMGRSFEEFIITRFNNEEYRLIEWRSDKYIPGWGGPVSCQWPDLVMEHISSGNRFAIECKFRSKADGNCIHWARPEQLQNYRDYETREKVPVYIAIDLGGEPDAPESLFIIRLERMKFPDVMLHYLEGFRFPAQVSGLEFG